MASRMGITSLNLHGKPIVMTPLHIADELLREEHVHLDNLVVGDRFFRKRA